MVGMSMRKNEPVRSEWTDESEDPCSLGGVGQTDRELLRHPTEERRVDTARSRKKPKRVSRASNCLSDGRIGMGLTHLVGSSPPGPRSSTSRQTSDHPTACTSGSREGTTQVSSRLVDKVKAATHVRNSALIVLVTS